MHILDIILEKLDILPVNYFTKEQYGSWITKEYDETSILGIEDEKEVIENINRYFTNSVVKRLKTDDPLVFFLVEG